MAKTNRSAGGVGESRVFRDQDAPEKDYLEDLRGLHFNGVPAEEIPDEALKYLRAESSDEHVAKARADGRVATATIVRSEFDKSVQKFGDGRVNDIPVWENPDPFKEVMGRVVPKGHRGRFLGDKKVSESGLRGWKPLLVDDGSGNKDFVKVGGMTLATMPEESAEKRTRHYQDLAERNMVKAVDSVRQQSEQIESLAKRKGQDIEFVTEREAGAMQQDRDFADLAHT